MEQQITSNKAKILEIYNQYKEYNSDFIYKKDLEVLLQQISLKCIPLNVENILQKMQSDSKQKFDFEEFIQQMHQQESKDINVKVPEEDKDNIEQNDKQDQVKDLISLSTSSIKDQLLQNSNDIQNLLTINDKQQNLDSKIPSQVSINQNSKSPSPQNKSKTPSMHSQSNINNSQQLSPKSENIEYSQNDQIKNTPTPHSNINTPTSQNKNTKSPSLQIQDNRSLSQNSNINSPSIQKQNSQPSSDNEKSPQNQSNKIDSEETNHNQSQNLQNSNNPLQKMSENLNNNYQIQTPQHNSSQQSKQDVEQNDTIQNQQNVINDDNDDKEDTQNQKDMVYDQMNLDENKIQGNLKSYRSNHKQSGQYGNEQNMQENNSNDSNSIQNEEELLEIKKKQSLDQVITTQENPLDEDDNNMDIMKKGSQNFFNMKRKSKLEEKDDEIIQDGFDDQLYGQQETNDQNFNNEDNSEEQMNEYKQMFNKNQFPNHENNILVLQEYQAFYKDLIDEVFARYAIPVDGQHNKYENENTGIGQDQQNNDEMKNFEQNYEEDQQDNNNNLVKVNNFTSIMIDLFKEKIWILTHKFDREEFHTKINGYRKLFQTMDNYFIKIKNKDPSTFKLTEAVVNKDEFFQILEYWSSCDPQLYFSQQAPKYQNIDEQDELNYKSSWSQMSQIPQTRNNNSMFSQDEVQTQNSDSKVLPDIKKAIQKYQKILQEADTDVERKVINNILSDLQKQQNQYLSQNNPNEINLLGNQYQNERQHVQGKNNIENNIKSLQNINEQDQPKSKSPSKRKIILNGSLLTKEEKRERNLLTIYKFYCKQSYVSGKYATFDRVQQESNSMNMGKFFLFVRDFGIVNRNLKKNKIVEIFKKNSSNSKDITFEEFKSILQKISEIHNEEQNNQEINQLETLSPENIKIPDQLNKNRIPIVIKKQRSVNQPINQESEKQDQNLNQKMQQIEKQTPEQQNGNKLEQFFNFLSIDDQNKLIEKVKSPNLPFHTHSKPEQNAVSSKINLPKQVEKQPEDKEQIKQRKESREKDKLKINKKSIDQKDLPLSPLTKKFQRNAEKKIKNEQDYIYGPTECTWESLQGNNYTTLKFLNHSEFKPTDLFDENTPEDDEYLEYYKIDYMNADQIRQKQDTLKKIHKYGELKPKKSQSIMQNDTSITHEDLQQLNKSYSLESSPQQYRANKIILRRNPQQPTRGNSQPQSSELLRKLKQSQSQVINDDNYINIDDQNESDNKSNIKHYKHNPLQDNLSSGQKTKLQEQNSLLTNNFKQSSNSIHLYNPTNDSMQFYSYYKTPEKKVRLRESRSLQKNSIDKSVNNSQNNSGYNVSISQIRNNKDLNNASVGDLIDFSNPITDRQKSIVEKQRQRISQIDSASKRKEKEIIDNLLNNSQNNSNLIATKLSKQNSNRQNAYSANKKNSYLQ